MINQKYENSATAENKIQPIPRESFNATLTQKKSFAEITASGQRRSQKLRCLDLIERHQPINARQLAILAKLEINAITRVVNDLQQNEPPLIKIAFVGPSNVTGKTVQWYSLTTWAAQAGEQLSFFKGSTTTDLKYEA